MRGRGGAEGDFQFTIFAGTVCGSAPARGQTLEVRLCALSEWVGEAKVEGAFANNGLEEKVVWARWCGRGGIKYKVGME